MLKDKTNVLIIDQKKGIMKDWYIFNIHEKTGKNGTFEIFLNTTRISVLKLVSQFIVLIFHNNHLEPKITNSGDHLLYQLL